ncbi:MAG: hypothetical protein ABEI86_09630, partial [Halobacteriaceae archaeon]
RAENEWVRAILSHPQAVSKYHTAAEHLSYSSTIYVCMPRPQTQVDTDDADDADRDAYGEKVDPVDKHY